MNWNFLESHFNLQNEPHKNKSALLIFLHLFFFKKKVCYYDVSLKIVFSTSVPLFQKLLLSLD